MQFGSLKDYSLLTGIGIQVVDEFGTTIHVTDCYNAAAEALDYLSTLLDVEEDVSQAKVKSLARSVEFGGIYTFLDPRGLVFATAPIPNDSNNRFVIGGPVISSSLDDYLTYELVASAPKPFDMDHARQLLLAAIPVRSAAFVSAFSEQMFVNAVFLGGRHSYADHSESEVANEDTVAVFSVSGNRTTKTSSGFESLDVRHYMYAHDEIINEQHRLLKSLDEHQEVQSKMLLNEILAQIVFHPHNNTDFIKSRIMELLTFMTSNATSQGADVKLVSQLRNRAYLEIEECKTLDDIVVCMNRLLEQLSVCTFSSTNSRHAEVIRQALDYMAENFASGITLNDVADHVSFSQAYLCTLFKKEVGLSFKNCLNRIRIERSKELMADYSLSIAAIACQVGFGDQSYFTRVFRQYEGTSPYQYRLTRCSAAVAV
ncbi:MAG: AraC family transcriptional regulator [Coriobacteriales bacterium]|jgi:AraC-like DNA-binding protein|nr:AraC family transcriptional regulator [Coriobacteriales bacterium]